MEDARIDPPQLGLDVGVVGNKALLHVVFLRKPGDIVAEVGIHQPLLARPVTEKLVNRQFEVTSKPIERLRPEMIAGEHDQSTVEEPARPRGSVMRFDGGEVGSAGEERTQITRYEHVRVQRHNPVDVIERHRIETVQRRNPGRTGAFVHCRECLGDLTRAVTRNFRERRLGVAHPTTPADVVAQRRSLRVPEDPDLEVEPGVVLEE